MTTILPLSHEWTRELKTYENNIHIERLKDLVATLHTSDILIDELNAKKIDPYKMKHIEIICSYYFAHCYHLASSIFQLCKLGFGSSAMVLSRSILESLVDMSYLWLCEKINNTDEERQSWLEYQYVQRYKMDEAWRRMQTHRNKQDLPLVNPGELFTLEKREELKNQFEYFKVKYSGRDKWATIGKIEQRARRVDDTQVLFKETGIILEEDYNMCYRWTSEVVHGTSSSSRNYFEEDERGALAIDFGANSKNIDIVLPMVTRSMLNILYIVNHINHLNVDLMKQQKASGFTTNNDLHMVD